MSLGDIKFSIDYETARNNGYDVVYENYRDLGNAIVERSFKDWHRVGYNDIRDNDICGYVKTIIKFLASNFCQALCGEINVRYLIENFLKANNYPKWYIVMALRYFDRERRDQNG